MRNAISRVLTVALLSGATGLLVLGHPAEVRAQSVFCPPNGSFGGGAISLQNGACTNADRTDGAFSGAALASQALSELSETTTQETTRNTIDAVTNRRAQEEQRCAEGFSRVDGTCQPIPKPVPQAAAPAVPLAPAPSVSKVREPRGRKQRPPRDGATAPRLRPQRSCGGSRLRLRLRLLCWGLCHSGRPSCRFQSNPVSGMQPGLRSMATMKSATRQVL
jgi:hypothetical protein